MITKNEIGKIDVTNNAINDIANVSIAKVQGIFSVKKDAGIASCSFKDDVLKIVLSLKVKQGLDIVKVSGKLQSKVHEAVLEMTGIDCKQIDVDIQGFVTK
ncbi:MAG: Asp23/Gls24 family envelope stress response protein [Erysipelotrichaceae bacterium]|nr:Asp23/Gls24 family envelope stress response protein [Erysipelotrichaceae bacterium]